MKELPPDDTTRWTARRKAAVAEAVEDGRLSPFEALVRYRLSPDELSLWRDTLATRGVSGLRVCARPGRR